MIKSLVLPAVLALVVALAGSASYAVMHARTEHAAQLATLDEIAKAHADSVAADSAHADSLHGDTHADATHADATHTDATHAGADSLPETPADSIRALLAERNGPGATSPDARTTEPSASHDAGAGAHDAPSTTLLGAGKDARPGAGASPETRPAAEKGASETIPEKRLAKIFSAMSPRDAAKVLEQMSDGDVRAILALMGDRQAAAVLTALPAARAAVISIGRQPRPVAAPDSGNTTP